MIDPKYTTLYNHYKAGDKPVIPNAVYKELLDRIELREIEFYYKCVEEYSLTEEQVILAEILMKK